MNINMNRRFVPYDIIKIKDKTFDELNFYEIALMIEADSSISRHGNEYFDSSALDVFLNNAKLKRDDLIEIREEILRRIYLDKPGSSVKAIDKEFLITYAANLKKRR